MPDCPYYNLNMLVAVAGLDPVLRNRLLNGDRQRAIVLFSLSSQEKEAVLAVQADTLPAFAQALSIQIAQQQPKV